MTSKCAQCNAPAAVSFTWGALPQQRANLCDEHAQQWWDTYKHTPAGQRLSISPTNVPDEKITAKNHGESECPTSQSAPRAAR